MSKLNELKELNPKLRQSLNRRDTLRKHVRKHTGNVRGYQHKIKMMQLQVDDHNEYIKAKVERLQAKLKQEMGYAAYSKEELVKEETRVQSLIKGGETQT